MSNTEFTDSTPESPNVSCVPPLTKTSERRFKKDDKGKHKRAKKPFPFQKDDSEGQGHSSGNDSDNNNLISALQKGALELESISRGVAHLHRRSTLEKSDSQDCNSLPSSPFASHRDPKEGRIVQVDVPMETTVPTVTVNGQPPIDDNTFLESIV